MLSRLSGVQATADSCRADASAPDPGSKKLWQLWWGALIGIMVVADAHTPAQALSRLSGMQATAVGSVPFSRPRAFKPGQAKTGPVKGAVFKKPRRRNLSAPFSAGVTPKKVLTHKASCFSAACS